MHSDVKNASLGKKIKELRVENGMTQEKLGEVLGVGKSTISLYENSKSTPDDNTKHVLADLFNVSMDYLMGRTSIKSNLDNLAAHFEAQDFTEDEIKEIEEFKNYVRSKRGNRSKEKEG